MNWRQTAATAMSPMIVVALLTRGQAAAAARGSGDCIANAAVPVLPVSAPWPSEGSRHLVKACRHDGSSSNRQVNGGWVGR